MALLVAPILICRAEKWFAAAADYSFIKGEFEGTDDDSDEDADPLDRK